MKIQFFLPMANVPTVTHQEKKIDWKRHRIYEGDDLKRTRQLLTDSVARHTPDHPLTGPVQLTVKWIWPKGIHKNGEYKITRPDTDNLDKLLKDCMTDAGFWNDDAQVVSEHIEKFWGDISGIFIKAEEIENEQRR